jgi:hypothetical protein
MVGGLEVVSEEFHVRHPCRQGCSGMSHLETMFFKRVLTNGRRAVKLGTRSWIGARDSDASFGGGQSSGKEGSCLAVRTSGTVT